MVRKPNQLIQKAIFRYKSEGLWYTLQGIQGILRNQWRRAIYGLIRHTNNPKKNLRRYITIRRFLQPSKYTKSEPFKLIFVNPDDIQYRAENCMKAWGRVSNNEWETKPFSEVAAHGAPIHESNLMHFVEGVPWEETPVYQARMNYLENNIRGWSSKDEVEDFFSSLDTVYDRIKEEGYLTQKELLEKYPEETTLKNNDAIHPELNEIGVNIYKDGETFLSHCGIHRLSIAKILDVKKIPIRIRTVHTQWEQIRRQTSSGAQIDNSYKNHPDLQKVTRT